MYIKGSVSAIVAGFWPVIACKVERSASFDIILVACSS
jgi:hypothetical protein